MKRKQKAMVTVGRAARGDSIVQEVYRTEIPHWGPWINPGRGIRPQRSKLFADIVYRF